MAIFAIISTLIFASPTLSAQQVVGANRKILILYSYSRSMPWEVRLVSGIDEYLASINLSMRPALFEESLDSARLGDPNEMGVWAAYLSNKYRDVHLDAVMSESQQAVFLLSHSPELFPGVRRYVFNYVPSESVPAASGLEKRYSSVSDIERAMLTIPKVLPNTKRIIVVNDRSVLGLARTEEIRGIENRFHNDFSIEVWDEFTEMELLDRVKGLPREVAIFYLPVQRDRNGATLLPGDIASKLARAAAVPVFSHFDSLLGTGIVGGYMISAQQLGHIMAKIALWGDSAAPVSQSDYATVTMGYYFDFRALERWGIRENRLPRGSTVLFHEKSPPEKYWLQLLLTIAAFFLETFLLITLARVSSQRKRANILLAEERATLEERIALRTADLAKANASLELLANTDFLTGCENRRHFLEHAEQETLRIRRYGGELSFLMLDLDHFKSINDRHGHQFGDAVLRKLVEICKEQLRDVDTVGRLGGEEFALLLPATNVVDAFKVAERLVQMIANCEVSVGDTSAFHFTASIGVASLTTADLNVEDLINRADCAMYRAKEKGRNCASD
jgi:diguanylate cyclase (GGDEF)-like protein